MAIATPLASSSAAQTQTASLPSTTLVTLEEYYSEAGPDYAAWSTAFNMHFGFYRRGINPLHREAMLEQMNREVLSRLRLDPTQATRILDLGCGLGATLRSFARRLPLAELTGITRVPWQVEQAIRINQELPSARHIRLTLGDYQQTTFLSASFDAVYALESSCHARGADKADLLREAARLLRPGGRLVLADGFLRSSISLNPLQRAVVRKLCECWVIEELGQLDLVINELRRLGFRDLSVEHLQYRVAPSVAHVPWVTAKFLVTDVLLGRRRMTRARWNNLIAPILLPWVGLPGGPVVYCMLSATKP